jgi:hypothetical protein
MVKPPENIHRFNVTALALLDRLYYSFPEPIKVDASHVAIDAAPSDSTDEGFWEYGAGADHVLTWLGEEGFLRYMKYAENGHFYGVRLTLKGLTVLGHVPVAVTEGGRRTPTIDRIRKALANGAEKAGTEAVQSIIGSLFRASLRYALPEASTPGVSV